MELLDMSEYRSYNLLLMGVMAAMFALNIWCLSM